MDTTDGEQLAPARHPVVRLGLTLLMITGVVASMVWGSWRIVGGSQHGISLADRLQGPGAVAGAFLVALLVVATTLLPWHLGHARRDGA